MTTGSADTPRKVSRNALINYRLRLSASAMLLAIFISIPDFQNDPRRWGMMALILIWPHLLYWFSRRAESGYKAEGRNILVDTVFEGLWLAALGFRLFPSILVIVGGSLNSFTYYGWRIVPMRLALIALGVAIGYPIYGFDLHLDTEPVATGLSIFAVIAYVTFVSATTYRYRTGLRETKLALQAEQEKSQQLLLQSEQLLLKVFPQAVIPRLNAGENPIADEFADVTVLFSDIVGYTSLAEHLGPRKTVMLLNDLYRRFDQAAAEHGVEKIETVGDGYLAVCGAPARNDHHPESVARFARAILEAARQVKVSNSEPVQIRIGIHTGPIFAGVIGEHRFHYSIFGETVNVAARVQGQSQPGRILVSESTFKRLRGHFPMDECGSLELKGHGPMRTYWLSGAGSATA